MKDENLPESQPPVKRSELAEIELARSLDQIIRPYFDGYWQNSLEKTRLNNEFDLKVLEAASKLRSRLIMGAFSVIILVLALAFYLFFTDRDGYAMELVVGIVIVIMSFIAGFGLQSRRGETASEE